MKRSGWGGGGTEASASPAPLAWPLFGSRSGCSHAAALLHAANRQHGPPRSARLPACPAQTFLDRRRYVLSVTDEVWAASIPRVEVYRWLLQVRELWV